MPPSSSIRALLRTTPTIAPVPHRALLSLTGSHAPEFLNGILASSIKRPVRGHLYSAFLHAQGRVLYDVFIYTQPDTGYIIEYDARPSAAPLLSTLLKRYVLRSKVKIRDVSAEHDVWSAWGSGGTHEGAGRRWKWASSGAVEPVWDVENPWGEEERVIWDRRAPGMGRRLLVKKGDRPQDAETHDVATQDAYTLHRILRGVPEGAVDMQAMQAFPMDSNLDVMGGLDFRKGCYVGQELTVRTYHTGVVRKRILPVVIHDPNTTRNPSVDIPSNIDIRATPTTQSETRTPRPRGTGKLLTSMQGVGLALLRLEHVEGVEKGGLKFEVEIPDGEEKKTWGISHWWPDWWPHEKTDVQT
ncbi:Aminomethyltransferase folate-binding domain-containing protein [Infundibulicybe gibba]|nr:Aminomethyltransferase folate-binding domain-containing protein [Infundibulicybe gibba]